MGWTTWETRDLIARKGPACLDQGSWSGAGLVGILRDTVWSWGERSPVAIPSRPAHLCTHGSGEGHAFPSPPRAVGLPGAVTVTRTGTLPLGWV